MELARFEGEVMDAVAKVGDMGSRYFGSRVFRTLDWNDLGHIRYVSNRLVLVPHLVSKPLQSLLGRDVVVNLVLSHILST